jgi:fibro-slime domain-containing protein
MKYFSTMVACLILIGFTQSRAQVYDSILWVPVTYYDFHSDGTCPDFQTPSTNGVVPNMVAQNLGASGKPELGTACYFSQYLKYWYRPWADSAQRDNTIPVYNTSSGAFQSVSTIGHSNSYINMVFEDSLPFRHVGNGTTIPFGTYEYLNDNFFPLDGRGFGSENFNHNFAFTMELHWRFTKVDGLTFNFRGDDDVWVYVDGQKRLDLGGIHGYEDGSFNLDNIPGLTNNEEYDLDIFYAERHTVESHIRITTNIISATPASIELSVFPSDTVCVGDTLTAIALVTDQDSNPMPMASDSTRWTVLSNGANDSTHLHTSNTQDPRMGDTVFFVPTEAYALEAIVGRLQTSSGTISDTILVYVKACYPDHINIEGNPPPFTNTSALRDDQRFDEITIAANQNSGNGYAIVRDQEGNFIEASQNTQWTITQGYPDTLDRVIDGNPTQGEGVVFKSDALVGEGVGELRAKSIDYDSIAVDYVSVRIQAITYDSLEIAVLIGANYQRITSLITNTDHDTLLIVRGKRSDNGQWEPINGNWSMTGLTSRNPPPNPGLSWEFWPIDTAHGTITVVNPNNSSVRASIPVVVVPGAPASIRLYPNATGTQYDDPTVRTYIDSAGIEFPLYAKIFDNQGIWLQQYDVLTAPINWSIVEVSGTPPTGSLTRTNGNRNGFTPTRAYNTVDLEATFSENGRIFTDAVRVLVVPGRPDHITIQADTSETSPDLTRLDMQSSQTTALLYAVLRDRYDNFIEFVPGPRWWSLDTTVVLAEPTSRASLGEGEVTRNSDNVSQTWVYATRSDGSMKDSILIALTDITYDTLRIYILDGGKRIIDTVRIRTDETVTLYVEGRRSDGMGWDNIPVTWTKSPTLVTIGTPPAWSDNWPVTPDEVGTGRITVSRSGAVSDSVVAIFLPGLPGQVRLYRRTGTPTAAGPYRVPPQRDTLTAGVSAPFVAKIFDRNNIWLSDYEASGRNSLFSWTVTLVDGFNPADTLSTRTGYQVAMLPTQAYNTYNVTVTFTEGTSVYSATAQVYVKPGAVDHLVIEGNPNPTGTARQNDNPLSTIEFGNRDTVKTAFAVLRDSFGNYISASQSTNWKSINTNIVTATEGLAVVGEGRVIRVGTLGSTRVVATNRNNSALFDTVDVVLSQFSYDSLRIVVDDSLPIEFLVMRSDQDTLLQVLGKRSFDGVWVPVNGDWAYISDNGAQSASSLTAWTFAPTDTGSGIIVVTRGSAVPDTVTVQIKPGNPVKIELYAREGSVPNGTNPPYPDPVTSIAAVAGTPFPLVAKVLDHDGVWLPVYETVADSSRRIKWEIIEIPPNDSSGFLDDTSGHKRNFTPVRARQSVYVVTSLYVDANHTLLDTVKLEIIPGKAAQLVIEGSETYDPIRPNPIDTAVIPSNTTNTRVHAIIRDSIGNFVRYSTVTAWGVVNNDTAVTVRNGNANTGEGVVSRNQKEGTVKVFAVDGTFRDTTVVMLLPFYYTQLRIVVGNDPSAQSLTMTTNDDTTLHVQGLRSDSLIWVDVEAHWENSSNLTIIPGAPGWNHTWDFSPADTGHGWIRVTLDDDAQTTPDTLPVTFLPGPPTKVTIKIVTPPDKRIAGEPIVVALEITNENGPVPGEYCFSKDNGSLIIYTDTLGDGGRPRPYVLIGTDTLWLTEKGDEQCFNGGRDTVTTTLFYVPDDPDDSLHRISVQLGGLTARTTPFILLPGELDSLALEYQSGKPVGDTITLAYPTGNVTMFSVGYDQYGNRIGRIQSDWSADSTLHDIDQPNRTERIVYIAANVDDNEAGTITAVPSDTAYDDISAKVFVKVVGPFITLVSAVTRDANGNGYLDQITLTFSRPVTFPEDYNFDEELKIIGEGLEFEIAVDSISGLGTRSDSVWVIKLKENTEKGPQTDWTPTISIDRNEAMTLDSMPELVAIDGAGPVIWEVTKEIKDIRDRRADVVTIKFSEPVQRATDEGQSLTSSDSLIMMLDVWEAIPNSNGTFTYVLVDSMLKNIDNIQSTGDDGLSFLVLNGVDIAPNHRISIRMIIINGDTTAYITDRAATPNLPEHTNQMVPVEIIGAPPIIEAAPNPTRPSASHVKPGQLKLEHTLEAKTWAQNGEGVLVRITLTIDKAKWDSTYDNRLPAVMKIYDFVGNIVNRAETKDLLKKLPKDVQEGKTSVFPVDFYWNGYNRDGMPVAPGLYRLVVRTDSKNPAYPKKAYVVTVGIKH